MFGLLCLNSLAFSQGVQKSYDDLLSEGLLLNHTITPMGQNFYKDFVAAWVPPADVTEFTIVITERFNPQWGSLVFITVDDDMVFQQFLSARNVVIEDVINQAVSEVHRHLFQREIIKRFQKSNDLEGDGY
ncbi:hypothetical protein AAU61_05120 [Desulfocarbo indianensis]|nr:hypothetical protein AAU61_05120 [Desulfocarbo indianensis]